MSKRAAVVGVLAWGLAGCAGSGDGLDENGRPPGEPSGELSPSIESIQDHVFTPRCVECHSGATPAQGLGLDDAETSYDNLVNVPSTQSQFLRVEPGNADDSYLIHKLEGTQVVGNRMPRNGPPFLTQDTIDVIRDWIDDGAAPPGSGARSLFLPAREERSR